MIVIDDASTGDSILEVGRSGVPVTLLHVAAGNAAAARNAGIEAASAIGSLLDADDVCYPNHPGRAADLLSDSDDVALMCSHDWIGLEASCWTSRKRFAASWHSRGKVWTSSNSLRFRKWGSISDTRPFFIVLIACARSACSIRVSCGGTTAISGSVSSPIAPGLRYGQIGWISGEYAGKHLESGTGMRLFYLRALVKNRDRVRCEAYRRHLARESRRAMGRAFVDAPAAHYARLRELAWDHLPRRIACFTDARASPSVARTAIRAKRTMLGIPPSQTVES